MLREVWQRVVDAFTGAHYTLRLHRQGNVILLTALRKDESWPLERMAADDAFLAACCRQLPSDKDGLRVPLPVLSEVREALQGFPGDTWFDVEVDPDVAALARISPPKDFGVEFVWSDRQLGLERNISHGAAYGGHGCFLTDKHFWHVPGTSSRDEEFLEADCATGGSILDLITRRRAAWQKRGLPYRCGVAYSGRDALTVSIGQVTPQAVELVVDWRIDPGTCKPIPSLPGYVFAGGVVMPGIAPEVLFDGRPDQHATCRVLSQDIPVFLDDIWPDLQAFCKGPAHELISQHRRLSAAGDLLLEIQSCPKDGIGSPAAVPVVDCEGRTVAADGLSQQFGPDVRYVRVPSGWLSVDALHDAGVGPMGRASDGTPLKPIVLSPAEVLTRGSQRVEGPWAAVRVSGIAPPGPEPSSEVTARAHLTWLLKWALPGGIVGSPGEHSSPLLQVCEAVLQRNSRAQVVVVGRKKDIDSLGPRWARTAAQRFDGKASDPSLGKGGGLVLATTKAIESTPALQHAKWDLLCLVGPDDLIKSNRSKLYDALTGCRARLVVGLFSSKEFLDSNAKAEAMSTVFGLSPGPSADLVWRHGLRDPLARLVPLPAPYKLRKDRPGERLAPVELPVGPPERRPAAGIPVPARVDGFRIAVSVQDGRGGGFVAAARDFARRSVRRASFVPFMSYWPTYADMSKAQLDWYFYWRGQVREGRYPDTDLSYVFVHVYELLNNVGVRNAEDGFRQLQALFQEYRDRYPKLANYLVDWMADYIIVNELREDPLAIYLEATEAGFEQRDVDLPLAVCIQRPLQDMPIVLLDQLTDYRIRKSKFYSQGYADTVRRYLGLALQQVDDYMRQQSGQGIFDLFRICDPQPVRRHPFQSALYAGDDGEITVAKVIPYAQHPPLREFLTGITKYTENRLRARHGYTGRLRGMTVSPAIVALIDRLIPTAKAVAQPEAPRELPVAPRRVSIDHEQVARLKAESDELMKRLLQDVEAATHVPMPSVRPEMVERPAGTPEGLLTDLGPVRDILKGLNPSERGLLQALAAANWEAEDGILADSLGGMLLEPPIDRINSLSLDHLGDLLIASERGRRVIAEDYRDELEHLLPKTKPAQRAGPGPAGLPPEWADFRRELADCQLKALGILVNHDDPRGALQQLAAGQGLMPEMLIDGINELAIGMVGDLVVSADAAPPTVCAESLATVQHMLRSVGT